MQTITRKGSFDSMHRVMNEKMKCFNIHGHTYIYELTFGFKEMEDIGYAIDFKEIKRIAYQWIDDFLDHGAILNMKDEEMINTCHRLKSKFWLMGLNEFDYCNPTVENIAKEIFLVMTILFPGCDGLWIESVRLWETPNCYTDANKSSIKAVERDKFYLLRLEQIKAYRESKGRIEYDDRKPNTDPYKFKWDIPVSEEPKATKRITELPERHHGAIDDISCGYSETNPSEQ